MKIGDRLVCKKIAAGYLGYPSSIDWTIINKCYTIVGFTTNGNILIIDEDMDKLQFDLCEIPNHQYHRYIWNYFYTEQELRKMKLEKLNAI